MGQPERVVQQREPVVVAKIGTSSITDVEGMIDKSAVATFCAQVATLQSAGHPVITVTSGAIAAGLPALGMGGDRRPRDAVTLQAASAVGQSRLLNVYDRCLAEHGLVGGQVLLAPFDFFSRQQYLHARSTLQRMLALGVVPVVNENDAIADDEIRFGDNDRLAALVSQLVGAEVLVLLTDTAGLLTSDPRHNADATLIEEIVEFDEAALASAGGAGTARGSGGMASKVAAARIASWSGVRTVIADASRPDVLADAVAGAPGVGTVVRPREQRLGARKLWIAFAVPAQGVVVVDQGAVRALKDRGTSLLPAGVLRSTGGFVAQDPVEVADPEGTVFAKGLVRYDAGRLGSVVGRRTGDLPPGTPDEVIHRDDLVMLH